MEKVSFVLDNNETVEFYVLEQTRLGGKDYLLVTEEEEGDADALILRDMSVDGESEAVYEIVTDDRELSAVAAMFEDMMDDVALLSEGDE
ncbi:MAG: DUF1292 domain-containing protein [Lachnospiraceae bacterium]|nr:DUF1292 domain-containing protein [Lachnospiraceae bacterium]